MNAALLAFSHVYAAAYKSARGDMGETAARAQEEADEAVRHFRNVMVKIDEVDAGSKDF
jgi:hypothetical protein